MKEYALFIMSSDSSLLIRAIVGSLAGLLIASGYLPSETKDSFINDASTVGGISLTIISLVYALEHALIKVKADLVVPGITEPAAVTKTVTATTMPTIPPTPTNETP